MNYEQALKPKEGWKYATRLQLLAAASKIVADRIGVQGSIIYEWCIKHGVGPTYLMMLGPKITNRLDPLHEHFLTAITNDADL